MNKVLVFSNAHRWNQLKAQFDVDNTLWNARYDALAEKKVLKYDIVDARAVLTDQLELSVEGEGVYIVYDQMDEKELKQLLDQCKEDEVFALLHTSGVMKSSLGPDVVVLTGNHDTEDEHYYYPLFEQLTSVEAGDTVAIKVSRIVDALFLDEVIMEFVTEFSEPKKSIGRSSRYRILCHVERFNSSMARFREKYESCAAREEYMEDLRLLRKELLSNKA